MLTKFFINRPIVSSVISIVLALMGVLSIPALPMEKLPNITPPIVQVTAFYPGASADILTQTVVVPLEQQINGVDNMIYMYSRSGSDGSCYINVSFEIGTDVDMAVVNVQNRTQRAMAQLPQEVQRQGVIVKKASTSFVAIVALTSPDNRYDNIFLSNYMKTRIRDELARIPGVGDTNIMGEKAFSMRVWLNPDKLQVRGLTTQDIISAIQEQNIQVAAGRIGAAPSSPDQPFALTITTKGRLLSVEEFGDIILRTSDKGGILFLKDVARLEMGAENYDCFGRVNGKEASLIAVYQAPGANAVQIVEDVRAKMAELSKFFPVALEYRIVFDTAKFVTVSLEEVFQTLIEAFFLVMVCVFIFLQDWRATLIPAAAIPVSILATCAIMHLMGFTINTLSLFGMVLAIGIVVDDAVIVVENVAHHLERGAPTTKEATFRAMKEVTGPVIGTTLVLMSVFIPTSLMPGITGQLYRQFAITIAVSVGFSAIVALTLSPALASVLMKPIHKKNVLFRAFDFGFDKMTKGYLKIVRILVRHVIFSLIGLVGIGIAFSSLFTHLPKAFIPDEDEGYFFVHVQLPPAASLSRTDALLKVMEPELLKIEGVDNLTTMGGLSMLDNANVNNIGTLILALKDWKYRKNVEQSLPALMEKARRTVAAYPEAFMFVFARPAIMGLGNVSGLSYQMLDLASVGPAVMAEGKRTLLTEYTKEPSLQNVTSTDQGKIPSVYVDVDREKVKRMHLSMSVLNNTLQANLAGVYVNDFNMFDRPWKVYTLAEAKFRATAADIGRLWVTGPNGERIPISSVADVRDSLDPLAFERYNLYPTISITAIPRTGYSTGQAVDAMKELSKDLPEGVGYAWTNMTFQELKAGDLTLIVFVLAFLFAFLILAALYESWSTPISVLLSVPAGQTGAMLLTYLRGFEINIYTQIGLVMLVGMVAKSAILLVEFAVTERRNGKSIEDAAVDASGHRFRALLMTELCMALGVLPLVIATGAGANSRQALGTIIFAGMVTAIIFDIFFIPMMYGFIARFTKVKKLDDDSTPAPAPVAEHKA